MNCTHVKLPDGTTAIICGPAPRPPHCKFCPLHYSAGAATLLCDAVVGRTLGGKPITCDRPVCRNCAKEVAPEKHLCPAHHEGFHV